MPSTSQNNNSAAVVSGATEHFVETHRHADVSQLALRGCNDPEVDLPLALRQIEGRQRAEAKGLAYAAVDGILYPPHLNMEQCSSGLTACYKAEVAARIAGTDTQRFVDLTGGFGVDFCELAKHFDEAVYVERNATLCDLARHNFPLMHLNNAKVVNAEASHFIESMKGEASLLFLDPARRDANGARTFAIGDCQPNVLGMLDRLLHKGRHVMLKLSPMLDIKRTVDDLGAAHVKEVHVVSAFNECKELLVVLGKDSSQTQVYCHDEGSATLTFSLQERTLPLISADSIEDFSYLYEPNAAIMKAGAFGPLSQRWKVTPVSSNSHLFLSKEPIKDFPGRTFSISAVSSMGKRELRQALGSIKQANVSVRNFPMQAEKLRQKLKLKDGGDNYIFATTLANGRHTLIICKK